MTKLLSLRAICNYKSPKFSTLVKVRKPSHKIQQVLQNSQKIQRTSNSKPQSPKFSKFRKAHKKFNPTKPIKSLNSAHLQKSANLAIKFSKFRKVRKKIQQKPAKAKPPKTQNLKSTPSFVLKDDEAPP